MLTFQKGKNHKEIVKLKQKGNKKQKMQKPLIDIILGPMYSGKSTELIRKCSRYESIGLSVLLINHIINTRTKDNM